MAVRTWPASHANAPNNRMKSNCSHREILISSLSIKLLSFVEQHLTNASINQWTSLGVPIIGWTSAGANAADEPLSLSLHHATGDNMSFCFQ